MNASAPSQRPGLTEDSLTKLTLRNHLREAQRHSTRIGPQFTRTKTLPSAQDETDVLSGTEHRERPGRTRSYRQTYPYGWTSGIAEAICRSMMRLSRLSI